MHSNFYNGTFYLKIINFLLTFDHQATTKSYIHSRITKTPSNTLHSNN